MKTFCIIDSFALMFRAYYALVDMKTQKGFPSGAIFGVTNFLLQIIETWNPDYLVAAIDMGQPTFRHEMYEAYKANRTEAPEDFITQIEPIFEIIRSFQIPLIGVPGFEADDLAGTLAVKMFNEHEDMRILCFTGDHDYFQLVNDRIHVFTPHIGFHKAKLYTPEAVFEKSGVHPHQIIDFKSLKGDTSDNVVGVPGIGDKTASKLLNEFETLEEIYENIEHISGKLQENLLTYKDRVFLNRELVKIRTDAPLQEDILEKSIWNEIPLEDIEPRLIQYECFSCIQKLKKMIQRKDAALSPSILKKENIAQQQSLF